MDGQQVVLHQQWGKGGLQRMDMAKLQRKNVHQLRKPRQVNSHLVIDRPRVVELIETGADAPLCVVRAPD
ncbi:hypothetical protein AS189_07360 [Arthrobacter alpinus]|uniref:Uncharacterized protein n=1 Tax=Arthrobacter alpinus TaxID=656366 RepID=A0A0S2LYV0_9MICC|nr:hypothetical protein AS189_07360 [Arthrobacter alpinus]